MATIPDKKLAIIANYYAEGHSAREVADKFGFSIDAVYYFFRKHKIPRREPRENSIILFNKKPASFNVKKRLSIEERELKLAGIMLYWGEGSQWPGETAVDFANSNPGMIKIFLTFLRMICGVADSKLRIYLYCYANQKPKKLMRYWSALTKISLQQFNKPYVRRDFKESKIGKMKYGLIHIRYHDKKLLLLIKKWISDFVDRY
ncbi:hypothetical protein KKD19_05285 [Patescibacteria group bacterium]|nr:hypothetical protein [Patescibacteria group bacterium]MBU4512619.1 hypothetical protein [Patescibacteria group bacterium]MCG2693332.1 hypothetical protein [Candidatus Parcubacteria bacterium]